MERLRGGSGVARTQLQHKVLRRLLCVVDGDVPETVVEHTGVGQLVLGVELTAPSVLADQVVVGKRNLWIEISPAHPRMRRRRVDVPPVFLGVLTVVALRAGQAEDALLEDRVDSVPERERETEELVIVTDPAKTFLAPAKGARPRLIVGDVVPRVASGAVVLAHRSPCAFTDVRSPAPPAGGIVAQPRALGVLVAHARVVGSSPARPGLLSTTRHR